MTDPTPDAATIEPAAREPFQARVNEWLLACFGEKIARDLIERNHRFLEESLELVQAGGCTASEAHQLVDYVFGRPVGEIGQEVGGVMNTLAALCLAHDRDMVADGDTEIARCWTKVDAIRAKQAAKPKHSPLPIAAISTALRSRSDLRVDKAEAAQFNLYHVAEQARERARKAEEAFDLIAPFVAKFAAVASHYDGGQPRYPGSQFVHDPEPGYRPALTSSALNPGVPTDCPTIGDLRMLAQGYAMAQAMRGVPITPTTTAGDMG